MSTERDAIIGLVESVDRKMLVPKDRAGHMMAYGSQVCRDARDAPLLALYDRSSPTLLRFLGFPVRIDDDLPPGRIEIRAPGGRVLAAADLTPRTSAPEIAAAGAPGFRRTAGRQSRL